LGPYLNTNILTRKFLTLIFLTHFFNTKKSKFSIKNCVTNISVKNISVKKSFKKYFVKNCSVKNTRNPVKKSNNIVLKIILLKIEKICVKN